MDGRRSVGAGGFELTSSNAGGVRHRVYVDVHVAVAGLLENLCQCGPTCRVDHVGVGDRRVAHPLPIDVPTLGAESRQEHDDRPVGAGRGTVKWAWVTRTPLSTLSVYAPAVAALLTRIL